MSTSSDLTPGAGVARLVDEFYTRVRADDCIGPIFNDIAKVNWAAHLPKMYAFWDSVLFGVPGFKGNPLAVHLLLAQQTPLTAREFDRWVSLFHATVDDLFEGPMATEAKQRAVRIATMMQYHIAAATGALPPEGRTVRSAGDGRT
ncbi:MAG TPA: group III truncated hemoglobin [Vicinamibacterales bacterium]|jgi:hemoglobin|nr:group III truncated hemoglobin [Vicinamibacterales bacterium]